jgi:hypothetical protein
MACRWSRYYWPCWARPGPIGLWFAEDRSTRGVQLSSVHGNSQCLVHETGYPVAPKLAW